MLFTVDAGELIGLAILGGAIMLWPVSYVKRGIG